MADLKPLPDLLESNPSSLASRGFDVPNALCKVHFLLSFAFQAFSTLMHAVSKRTAEGFPDDALPVPAGLVRELMIGAIWHRDESILVVDNEGPTESWELMPTFCRDAVRLAEEGEDISTKAKFIKATLVLARAGDKAVNEVRDEELDPETGLEMAMVWKEHSRALCEFYQLLEKEEGLGSVEVREEYMASINAWFLEIVMGEMERGGAISDKIDEMVRETALHVEEVKVVRKKGARDGSLVPCPLRTDVLFSQSGRTWSASSIASTRSLSPRNSLSSNGFVLSVRLSSSS